MTGKVSAKMLQQMLHQQANPAKAATLQRFFKTGKGEYGEGDVFLGVTVPEQREIARAFQDLPLSELLVLLRGKHHEERLTALLILAKQFQKGDEALKKSIFEVYLQHTRYINNWDLVDSSAEFIVGAYLENKDKTLLCRLADSPLLWERRIAMLSTFHYIKKGQAEWALKIAELLLKDSEDLIHKAVGWMLREIGKRCSEQEEEAFLEKYFHTMHRTTLRYAIERFEETKRKYWLNRTAD